MLVSSASINQTLLPITCYLVILISVNWLIIIIISLETELYSNEMDETGAHYTE